MFEKDPASTLTLTGHMVTDPAFRYEVSTLGLNRAIYCEKFIFKEWLMD